MRYILGDYPNWSIMWNEASSQTMPNGTLCFQAMSIMPCSASVQQDGFLEKRKRFSPSSPCPCRSGRCECQSGLQHPFETPSF